MMRTVFVNVTDGKSEFFADAAHLLFELGLERELGIFHGLTFEMRGGWRA